MSYVIFYVFKLDIINYIFTIKDGDSDIIGLSNTSKGVLIKWNSDNIDRHFNNFGYIINGSKKYCPIFDNGLSLYSDLSSEDIININKKPYLNKRFDKCKPFAEKHISQIKLIKNLPKINLSSSNDDFIAIIEEYESYLGAERFKAMCDLLKERLNYVRELYSNA